MRFHRHIKITRRAATRGAALLCLVLLGAGGVAGASKPGWAQQSGAGDASASSTRRDSRRVLHEYFDPWSVNLSGQTSVGGSGASADAASSAFIGMPGQPPGLSLEPATDEMILGNQGPVDAGKTATPWGPLDPGSGAPSRLDSATDRVDQLNYWANFEPSVVPYKRVVVQNQVRSADGQYSLHLAPGRYRSVAIEGGAERGNEDVFWGSFLLRARAGERHPIPSVAPQQRILSVQAAPMVGLRVERDEADNFYIVPASDGLLRVNMKLAVPRVYFDGELSATTTWREFSQAAQARDARLSPHIKDVAANVLKLNGASHQMAPRDALFALIEYYRDFEARPFPESLAKDDLYTAISAAQIGVCRHRSLAFVISARALGIPARYIYNEAHAFVEIYWPKLGWRRVDLGGAAEQLDYSGRRGGGVHQAAPDALPQPPNYISELERMGADIPGYQSDESGDTSDAQVAANGLDAPDAEEQFAEDSVGATDQGEALSGEVEPGTTAAEDDALAAASELMQDRGELPTDEAPAMNAEEHAQDISDQTEHAGASAPPEPEADPRQAVRIDVVASNPEIFRGTALQLNGSIFSLQGRAISRALLKVYLGPLGADSTDGLVLLGEIESDAGGRFSGQFPIAEDISIGRWSVILRYDGSDKYLPAQVD
ncbi:transglutaminase-like domain-containing protein [Bradymonas sediminis]|uniref:Uncharacterized protein n=1 Tax=Bradymonas sediminis TaxID=1548548 RepID=A0A2Z4FI78_9DELT|nr:transglutaminase domain-containing protein [Bradymonas sediminis]AWV88751.1 hypothetical protein DN745_05120 [Bradymonas sediminis]TDP63556.1 transglutaminase superfamily protein [Bradymonas sediminis]